VIYNPTSGKEMVKRNLPYILDRLEVAGYETSVYSTKAVGDATYEAARACEADFDVVVAAGGNGTLHEVISGMAAYSKRPKRGVLPV
jgi:diacylglycerol kinase (ATP)